MNKRALYAILATIFDITIEAKQYKYQVSYAELLAKLDNKTNKFIDMALSLLRDLDMIKHVECQPTVLDISEKESTWTLTPKGYLIILNNCESLILPTQ